MKSGRASEAKLRSDRRSRFGLESVAFTVADLWLCEQISIYFFRLYHNEVGGSIGCWSISMKIAINLGTAAIAVLFGITPVMAASVASDRHWSTNHLAQLPAELQRRVLVLQRACGSEISARHYFSTSIEIGKESFRALHFQDLSCQNRRSICAQSGCLHEIYRRANGTFEKVFDLFAQDVRMENDSGMLLIKAAFAGETQTFRWTGRTMVRGTDSSGLHN